MASDRENQNDQSRKEPGQGQSVDPNQQPPAPPSANHQNYPPLQYQPAMSYPPPPYPHGQPPPGYPPPPAPYPYYQNGYNQQPPYPYAQPPPATYYNNYHPDQYAYQNNNAGAGFIRRVMLVIIFLITLTILSTLVTYIVLHPEIPDFHVDSFAVSNFNITNPRFVSNWEAKLTVVNPNTKLRVDLENVHSYIFYKEDELASSIMNSESLEKMTNMSIVTALTSNIADQSVIGDLSTDRAAGNVIVSLRMSAYSTFTSGSWWTKHSLMRVFCEDMMIVFAPGASSGVLATGDGKDCLVYV